MENSESEIRNSKYQARQARNSPEPVRSASLFSNF